MPSTLFSQLTIMALRHMARWPVRAGATSLGIAIGVGLLVTALLSFDSVELMIDVAFFRTERQQATLNFTDEKHGRALQVVERLPGVLRAEPYRSVAVRLRNGHSRAQLSIVGKPQGHGSVPRARPRLQAGAPARRPAWSSTSASRSSCSCGAAMSWRWRSSRGGAASGRCRWRM